MFDVDAATLRVDDPDLLALRVHLAKLDRAQQNLLAQLETNEPSGDERIDAEWRTSLQKRFATISTERRDVAARITELGSMVKPLAAARVDKAALLEILPITGDDLTPLPEDVKRQLYDAFHLQIRYNRTHHRITIRVTISASTIHTLADTIAAATTVKSAPADCPTPGAGVHAVRAPGGTRTRTRALLRRLPLPLGYEGRGRRA
jgi:site-specific DNA recombinase